MALRARKEDENGIEYRGDRQAEVGQSLVLPVRCRKPTQVCPAEQNVAARHRVEHAEESCPFSHTSRRSSLSAD